MYGKKCMGNGKNCYRKKAVCMYAQHDEGIKSYPQPISTNAIQYYAYALATVQRVHHSTKYRLPISYTLIPEARNMSPMSIYVLLCAYIKYFFLCQYCVCVRGVCTLQNWIFKALPV